MPDESVTTKPVGHTMQRDTRDLGHVLDTNVMPLWRTLSRVTTNDELEGGNRATSSTEVATTQVLAATPLNRVAVQETPARNGLPEIVTSPPVCGRNWGVTLMMTGDWASRVAAVIYDW